MDLDAPDRRCGGCSEGFLWTEDGWLSRTAYLRQKRAHPTRQYGEEEPCRCFPGAPCFACGRDCDPDTRECGPFPDNAWGHCSLETVAHESVTRDWIFRRTEPVLIAGATEGWAAHKNWDLAKIMEEKGDVPFLDCESGGLSEDHCFISDGRKVLTLREHLSSGTTYGLNPVGQTLFKHIAPDLTLPHYVFPHPIENVSAGPTMEELLGYKLNLGMGNSKCLGVQPEAHGVGWFVQIKGRKRWVLTPPSQNMPRGSSRSSDDDDRAMDRGGGIPEDAMRREAPFGRCCVPRAERLAEGAHVCDVPLGTILWTPRGWWHETCGLDVYNIGIGGDPAGMEAECPAIIEAPGAGGAEGDA